MSNSGSFLSEEFLSQYNNIQPRNKGILFDVLHLRTYSRWIPELKRREKWAETVQRVVEYNVGLYQGPASRDELVKEAELMFDKVFNLEVLPSGRSLWIGGTDAARKHSESNFNCFKRDTRFLTRDGIKSFEDFEDGDTTQVLCRWGSWKNATVKNFGKQKLYSVVFGRDTLRKEILVTANHRWVIENGETREKTTLDLKPEKDRVQIVIANCTNPHFKPCKIGIQHGLVFGDGTLEKRRGACRIDLWDDSQQFASYFTTGTLLNNGDDIKDAGRRTTITGLPSNWKQLPSLDMNPEYLYGFLVGWFAADGSYSEKGCALYNKDKEVLEWAKSAFSICGIYSGDVKLQREISPFTGDIKPLYKLSLHNPLPKQLFIKESHIANHKEMFRKSSWKVISVSETDLEEDVWCVSEPETQTFTLDNGMLTRNCSGLVIKKLDDFCDIFHLLLCGCGVGYRVLKSDVINLPLLNTNFTVKHSDYSPKHPSIREEHTESHVSELIDGTQYILIEIGDSKGAWVEALRLFLHLLVSTNVTTRIMFSYDNIRPEGDRIKTFGGIAPGPNGLIEMFKNLESIIKNAEGVITPVVAMDIANTISMNVIVGGTRRSALIALGDPDDKEFIEAKKDLYTKIDGKWIKDESKASRNMSNNTVVYNEKPTLEHLKDVFSNIKYNGEPGFLNLAGANKRRPNANTINPCGEILMDDYGMCLTADTKILTKEGHLNIVDCDGKDVYVPYQSDKCLTKNDRYVKAKLLNKGQKECFKVSLQSHNSIKATKDHLFLVRDQKKLLWKKLEDLTVGDYIVRPYSKTLPNFDINKEDQDKEYQTVGWMIGDGWFSDVKKKIYGACFGPSEEYAKNIVSSCFNNWWNSVENIKNDFHKTPPRPHTQPNGVVNLHISKKNVLDYLDDKFGLYPAKAGKKDLPEKIKTSNPVLLASVLGGLFSADGSIAFDENRNKYSIHLSSSSINLLKSVQSSLICFGIHSSITFGELSTRPGREQGHLTIKGNNIIGFYKYIGFPLSPNKQEKLNKSVFTCKEILREYLKITNIESVGTHSVYDLSLEEGHHFIANNVVVHNCNLSTVVITSHITEDNKIDYDRLEESVRLATRIGLRQTNVSLSLPHWDEVQKRDRLTGVSMTGFMDAVEKLGLRFDSSKIQVMLESMRHFANDEADLYAFEMRVPRPLLVTSIKPEGSLSQLPTVSSGLHKSYAPYYIRRIRVSALDPVCKALKELGIYNEPDMTKKNSSRVVFSFPVKSSATSAASDESALDQFNRYLQMQKLYTDHNSSCTLTVGDDEWESITQAVYDNWDNGLVACTFLSKDCGNYPQMPYEAISKEEYDSLMINFPKDLSILYDLVNKYELEKAEDDVLEDDECKGGHCPVR